MAFNGNLITVGNYNIPLKFIKSESYSAYRNVQDLDSYRDANGLLHRTAVEHVPIKVEFQIQPLNSTELKQLMNNIKKNYSIALERKASVVAYIPEIDDYITQDMYLVQPQPVISKLDVTSKMVYYESMQLSFVGY